MQTDNIKNLNENNMIYLYKFIKIDFGKITDYLSYSNFEKRIILSKFEFRICNHGVQIEVGRYNL